MTSLTGRNAQIASAGEVAVTKILDDGIELVQRTASVRRWLSCALSLCATPSQMCVTLGPHCLAGRCGLYAIGCGLANLM
jgi:hypothetical protein